ncbi:MAG: hypothetical protein HOP30_11130 [Cyclobacteriaceae bacterium]|nr:hypothetical protein [Cyclobacteriaceae bacterium]
MRNKIEDLRNHMFAALEKLAEAETTEEMAKELERSKGIADLGKVIIDSAKVEVDLVKAIGGDVTKTTFFNEDVEVKKLK